MTIEVQTGTMRVVRFIFAVLIALGLGLSPVAAGMAQAKMVKCDHEQMMDMGQPEAAQSMDQDECACCKVAAKCPPSACALKCFGSQAVLAADAALLVPVLAQHVAEPAVIPRSLTFPPEPPPPRA